MKYASTLLVQGDPTKTDIDTGFWVYNPGTRSNLPIFFMVRLTSRPGSLPSTGFNSVFSARQAFVSSKS